MNPIRYLLSAISLLSLLGCAAPDSERWPAYHGQPHTLTNGAPIEIDWQGTNVVGGASSPVPLGSALESSGEVRRAMALCLRLHPACAWCGATNNLNAHHILPAHRCARSGDWPALAAQTNLLTLCRQDHFLHGHLGNWTNWNPRIREEVNAKTQRPAEGAEVKP